MDWAIPSLKIFNSVEMQRQGTGECISGSNTCVGGCQTGSGAFECCFVGGGNDYPVACWSGGLANGCISGSAP